jgi:hypothetical protein
MLWARMVAYVAGTVNQELLLRNEYLGAENRILRGQIKGRLLLSEGEKATLAIGCWPGTESSSPTNSTKAAVRCREWLGGLLKYYEREAA